MNRAPAAAVKSIKNATGKHSLCYENNYTIQNVSGVVSIFRFIGNSIIM